jgi:hypothetical protein
MKVPTSGLTFAVAVLLLFSATADAAMLGWWRFGDDDGGLAAPPVDGADIGPGSAANQRTVNHMGGLEGMYFQTALPEYSVVVPMKQGISDIYDPYTDTTLSNAWSMYTPGAGQERLRPGTVAVPTTFTFETFVQPQSVHTMVIVNHQSSTTNGWRVTLNSNGSVAAHLYAGGNEEDVITSAPGLIPMNEWHHVAVVYQNSSEDGVNDFFLYVDYNLVAEGNGSVSPSGSPTLHVGNPSTSLTGRRVRLDEIRYFNEAITPDQFLRVVPEPNSLFLVSMGVFGMGAYRRRRREARS